MNYFEKYAKAMSGCLHAVEATDAKGNALPVQRAFDIWHKMSTGAKEAGRLHYFIGNGASATMSSHMALDCSKNAGLRALAFNDSAYLTAIGNDISFEEIFAAPIRWHAHAGDILVAITSAGRSRNILAGVSAARERGLGIVTLTGMGADNPARKTGDINFYVPAKTYGFVESIHQALLHCWLDQFMGLSEWGS